MGLNLIVTYFFVCERIHMRPSLGLLHHQLANWLLRPTPRGAARQAGSLAIGIASDVGNVRSENEDRVAVCRAKDRLGQQFSVVAIADGIGGMRDGMECAAIAIATIFETVYREAQRSTSNPAEWLEKGLVAANQVVHAYFAGKGGTTAAVVLLGEANLSYWASIGDSRIYELKADELIQLSKDDTIAGQLGRESYETSEQSLLLQYIGMGPELVVSVKEFNSRENKQLLLCTDGVYFISPDRRLLKQVLDTARRLDTNIAARRLVEMAKWAGGPDNATAAVISLPSNLESAPYMPEVHMEVWDTHGEIVFAHVPVDNENYSHSTERTAPPPNQTKAKRVRKPPSASNKTKSVKKTAKKVADNEPVNDSHDSSQVQLKFSSDTNN